MVTDVLLTNAAVLVVAAVAVWLVSLAVRDASIADLFWGLGFVIVAWVAYGAADAGNCRHVLLAVLVTVWGLRLTGYLAWRNIGKGEDPRYQAMRRHWGRRFWWVSLFTVFLFQLAMMWVVSLPVQVAMAADQHDTFWPIVVIGVVLWVVGLTFETVGDLQLARFKKDPDNQGKVLDTGLWRYTRHPNYFGDFAVWWGIYAVAMGTIDPWWTIVGPLLMTFLLLRVSGVAMLERTITKRRPEYADYVRRTSAFFPRPPRR